ncbi:MAG: MarR family winged helix-turn-helix transcriptional regulator [Candidatus Cryosericum sp.]
MKDTAVELESLLREISYWIKKKGRDALSDVKITLPQFQVLQLIYFGEALNVKDLTRLTGLAASTVSEMVDRLVELTYVTKMQNSIDKRQVILTCTKEGASIIRRVIRQRVRTVRKVLDTMRPETSQALVAELAEFVRLSK